MKRYIHSATDDERKKVRAEVEEYFNPEYNPKYADKFLYICEIFWDGITMMDVESFVADDANIDLSKVDTVRCMDDDEASKVKEKGYEWGYVVTYKDGTTKMYAWKPYPHNLDPLDEVIVK